MQFQPAPAWGDGIEREVSAVRLKLHAGGWRGHHSPPVPVKVQLLVNMTAQQMLNARKSSQRAIKRPGIAQAMLIQPATA